MTKLQLEILKDIAGIEPDRMYIDIQSDEDYDAAFIALQNKGLIEINEQGCVEVTPDGILTLNGYCGEHIFTDSTLNELERELEAPTNPDILILLHHRFLRALDKMLPAGCNFEPDSSYVFHPNNIDGSE